MRAIDGRLGVKRKLSDADHDAKPRDLELRAVLNKWELIQLWLTGVLTVLVTGTSGDRVCHLT